MKKLLLIFLGILFSVNLFAQINKEAVTPKPPKRTKIPKKEEAETDFYIVAEEMPEPEGGMEAFYDYINQELNYPEKAKNMGVEGKVFVQFIVDLDASLINIKIVKGLTPECDTEAFRLIKSFNDPQSNAPKWNPGKQRGKAVRVKMVLPVAFMLKK